MHKLKPVLLISMMKILHTLRKPKMIANLRIHSSKSEIIFHFWKEEVLQISLFSVTLSIPPQVAKSNPYLFFPVIPTEWIVVLFAENLKILNFVMDKVPLHRIYRHFNYPAIPFPRNCLMLCYSNVREYYKEQNTLFWATSLYSGGRFIK